VYQAATAIFENDSDLLSASISIAEQLYDSSSHPMVKPGELYVVQFSNCILGEDKCDAIGIFKSENKERFLKVYHQQNKVFNIGAEEGININKLDKGCIIFNAEKKDGYRVLIVDHANQEEAKYWKDDFLQLAPMAGAHLHTKNILKLCSEFCAEMLTEENNVSRQDQMVFKNRTADFFKQRDNFKTDDFEDIVLETPQVIDAFREYKRNYEDRRDVSIPDEEFPISNEAYKQSGKFLKSILKLDKNFHVYVHTKHDLIEKGYDDVRNKHFYKLYFDQES
jgi:hypothetical protein